MVEQFIQQIVVSVLRDHIQQGVILVEHVQVVKPLIRHVLVVLDRHPVQLQNQQQHLLE